MKSAWLSLIRKALAAVSLITATAAATGCSAGVTDGGPLKSPPAHGWATTQPVGQPFTDGLEILHLSGDTPAVIESVTLVGDSTLKLVGVRLASPNRTIASAQKLPWPPVSDEMPEILPAIGATITPESQNRMGWPLLVGIKVTEPGYHVRNTVRVEYTVAGERYVQELQAQLAVCTSTDMEVDGNCPFPEE